MRVFGLFHATGRSKRDKDEDKRALLAAFYAFSQRGVDEVSLPQLVDCLTELQNRSLLSYKFPEGLPYSAELYTDLSLLQDRGLLHAVEYTHNSLMPKSYYLLTLLGKGASSKAYETLPPETRSIVDFAVEASIAHNEKMWRLFGRKKQTFA